MTYFHSFNRLVVKVGSSLFVDRTTHAFKERWFQSFCEDIAALRQRGADVIVVTSGSVALGRGALRLTDGPLTDTQRRCAAACGQARLMQSYHQHLGRQDWTAAQVLVSRKDVRDQAARATLRGTLETLVDLGAVPVVNENDTTSCAATFIGNNDDVAARIGCLVGADCVVLLSDIDGLYSANPMTHSHAFLIDHVSRVTPVIEAMAGDSVSGVGTGGMRSKIDAARLCLEQGVALVIGRGDGFHPLSALENGARHTLFSATPSRGETGVASQTRRALNRSVGLG